MRNLFRCLCCCAVAVASVSLAAQTTGRITGRVLDTAGKPILTAKATLVRFDIDGKWPLKVNKKGEFIQVGLYPTEYELTVEAEGYVSVKEIVKVPLNDVLVKNITLKTPEEQLSGGAAASGDANAASAVGDAAYSQAAKLYNDGNYAEAIPLFDEAIAFYTPLIAESKDESVKAESEKFMAIAVDRLSDSLFRVGKENQEQREELWLKAEPMLVTAFENEADLKSENRARLVSYLAEISKMKGDAASEKKYLDILEEIEGPKAGNSYNVAVKLYNAGKLSEAKPHLLKAIEIDPTFSESYYLLSFCELNAGNMKAAKANMQKYIELDPNGKYADELREMLAEL